MRAYHTLLGSLLRFNTITENTNFVGHEIWGYYCDIGRSIIKAIKIKIIFDQLAITPSKHSLLLLVKDELQQHMNAFNDAIQQFEELNRWKEASTNEVGQENDQRSQ